VAQLWWQRLRAHLTPRSVYLQNAVRLAVGLAIARVIAGVFDLSHGFWVLLATLSLMRTCTAASRAALRSAFAGTVVGAIVAGLLLIIIGDETPVYAVLAPILMLVAFAAGPLLGIAASQAGFTLVVATIFAQVSPSTWRLAEARLLDVVVGGLVGALIGAAVWPRGGGGEVRRAAAETLRSGADEIGATVAFLTGPGGTDGPSPQLVRLTAMFDHTYAQYRSEPAGSGHGPDWLALLGVVHRMLSDARILRARHPEHTLLPWPEVTEHIRSAAAELADDYRGIADGLAQHANPRRAAVAERAWVDAHPLDEDFAAAPAAALRAYDTWGWVHALVGDLARSETALGPPAAPGPSGPSGPPDGSEPRSARLRGTRDTS
jgi:uncharacterized membrane protein YccC